MSYPDLFMEFDLFVSVLNNKSVMLFNIPVYSHIFVLITGLNSGMQPCFPDRRYTAYIQRTFEEQSEQPGDPAPLYLAQVSYLQKICLTLEKVDLIKVNYNE